MAAAVLLLWGWLGQREGACACSRLACGLFPHKLPLVPTRRRGCTASPRFRPTPGSRPLLCPSSLLLNQADMLEETHTSFLLRIVVPQASVAAAKDPSERLRGLVALRASLMVRTSRAARSPKCTLKVTRTFSTVQTANDQTHA